jgi:hypothetical protein
MHKGCAFFLSAVTLATLVVTVAACSGDDDDSTFKESPPDAASDSPGSFNLDGGGFRDGPLGEASPGASCEPLIPDGYKPVWNAPVAKGAPPPCSAGQVDDYFAACVASLGTDGAEKACADWKAASAENLTCATCAEPTNNSGPIQWHQDRYYYTLNIAGCIALKQSDLDADGCGAAYSAAVQCSRDACGGCFKTEGATFDDFRNCQNIAASTGQCASLETQQSATCNASADGGVKSDPTTSGCFRQTSEGADVFFKRVIGTFCGP